MNWDEIIAAARRKLEAHESPSQKQLHDLLMIVDELGGAHATGPMLPGTLAAPILEDIASSGNHNAVVAGFARRLQQQPIAAALQVSDARFRAIFEHAAIGIALVNQNGRLVESNRALQSFLGYSGGELAVMTFTELTHPEDVAADLDLDQALRNGEQDRYQVEKRYLRKDGSAVWGRLTVSLIHGPQHSPLMAIGMVEDITARKQAELEHRESDARKAAILAAAPDAIITIDHTGRVLEWNPAAETLFGYTHAETVGRDLAELIVPPEWRERHRQGLARAFVTGDGPLIGRRVEMTGMREDGRSLPVEMNIAHVPLDGPPLFTAYARDISERKRIEEALRFLDGASRLLVTSLDYTTTVAQVARLAVPFLADCCTVDVVADEHAFDRRAVAHVDPAKEDSLRVLQDRFPIDPSRSPNLRSVLQTGQAVLLEEVDEALVRHFAPDPEHRSMLDRLGFKSVMVVPLAAHGRVFGTVIFAITESERRYEARDLVLAQDLAAHMAYAVDNARLYEELQQALAARDEFLSLAAHELRSPLAGIAGYLRLLAQRGAPLQALPQLDPTMPEVMAAQAGRLSRLIDGLLDLTRVQSGQIQLVTEPIDLVQLAMQVITRLGPTMRPRVVWQSVPGPLIVKGDVRHLEEVVSNLIDNALKYSPADRPVSVWAGREQGQAVLAVHDEGIGIPEADQIQLFQRFYRAGNVDMYLPAGLGIGLYLSQEIVRLHGGRIEVVSAEGQGSTFTVRLPLANADRADASE